MKEWKNGYRFFGGLVWIPGSSTTAFSQDQSYSKDHQGVGCGGFLLSMFSVCVHVHMEARGEPQVWFLWGRPSLEAPSLTGLKQTARLELLTGSAAPPPLFLGVLGF